MSRSYKKSPVCTDLQTPNSRWSKRQASKAVRRFTQDVQNGKWYRRVFCSWIICDYRFFKTKQQAIHEWETAQWPRIKKQTRAEVINKWARFYKRK